MMYALIKNENMKIYKRLGTKIMFVILAAVIVFIGLVMRFANEVTEPLDGAGEPGLQIEQSDPDQMANMPESMQVQIHEQEMLGTYLIEEEVSQVNRDSMLGFAMENPQLVSFVTMFTVIVGAGIVAGEHSKGTIKLLMIRPVKRWKILLSKWLSTVLFSIVMVLTLIVISLLTGGFLYGFSIDGLRVVEVVDGAVRDMSVWGYMAVTYSLAWVELIIMTTFAFMLGAVFRNQSLSIGLSLVMLFTGGQVVFLLSSYDWAKYLLFAHTNLLQHFNGQPMIEHTTAAFSVGIVVFYFTVFKAIAYLSFSKRDIAD
ncbi:ABC transporter permease [Salisediminibacterium selenitireducens]|uniref:ABC-2 type transport system permease protein n=1 Tax=Bacillus selenitireducens (strain ATCC 700615 / DSM 15326 / MLS10) TaxID=439292 RepID=D6XUB0_BACIE|nr:ABC transporter permease subunit [Salisediminibacterium selenitireducens]ADH99396.1 hypothetical protein Bsel_1892 [[Bacillus] selenitireducens MLS10]